MNMKILIGFTFFCLCTIAQANSPEDLLQDYIELIHTENYGKVASVLSADARAKVKSVFDDALIHEHDAGRSQLQISIFNRKVTRQDIESTSAEVYLSKMMRNLLTSTAQQGVKLDSAKIVGRVDESVDQAHLLVRVFMSQHDTPFDNLQVFSFTRVDGNWAMEIPVMVKQVLEMMHYNSQR